MRRKLAALISLTLTLWILPATTAVAANPKAGAKCSKAKQVKIYKGMSYTCIKSGKKLIWNQGVVQVKPAAPVPAAPIATSAPTSTSTSADVPAPSSELETPTPGATCSRNKNSLKNC